MNKKIKLINEDIFRLNKKNLFKDSKDQIIFLWI